MERYPDIADHGLIGDLQTAALVSTDGTIDWFCAPRFDSPSIFASLLDADKGGFFRIGPDEDDYVTRQLYMPGTAILITRFMTPEGVAEVSDFMPVSDEGKPQDKHRLVRMARAVRGSMKIVMEIQPRFDYARKSHQVEMSGDGAVFRSEGGETLTMHRVAYPGRSLSEEGTTVERAGDGIRITKVVEAGQIGGVVIEYGGGPAKAMHPAEIEKLLDDTTRFWNRWLDR